VLLIIVMIFRPQGIWPHRVEEKPARGRRRRSASDPQEVSQ
jgi:branched-chain amino acid transport system permease protein